MSNPAIEKYGWTAVPRKVSTLLAQSPTASSPAKPVLASTIELPRSPLVKTVHQYTKEKLAVETFNHSMRVYYYGSVLLFLSFFGAGINDGKMRCKKMSSTEKKDI